MPAELETRIKTPHSEPMIKYQLQCSMAHEFEGWFGDSEDYDRQEREGLLSCPVCGCGKIEKALMAPALSGVRKSPAQEKSPNPFKAMRDYVERNFENVGERFPEEARKIHYGESERRAIYGAASLKECKELVEEGVEIAPLPGTIVKREKLN